MKNCSKCHINKELAGFSKDKQKKDGYSSHCKLCCSDKNKRHYLKNPEAYLTNNAKWKLKNPEYSSTYKKKYQEENKDLIKANSVKYYIYNRDLILANNKKWKAENLDRNKIRNSNYYNSNRFMWAHHNAKRRAAKINATVVGFEDQIRAIYQSCPRGFEVDHIVPLQGKQVCGLHAPWNLQYLPKLENRSKGNRF